ncbi:hypothetical protein CYY_003186 [Polysphondylium violaceum]|uniref:Uncharacterized protein n=1 Tax=Polysphondylium violaceum TaxID=133409 RepID=A0A8J4V8X5_9MYCE|nr:hypothetical protein CYY_003186 [Polysphondylium violaceum]
MTIFASISSLGTSFKSNNSLNTTTTSSNIGGNSGGAINKVAIYIPKNGCIYYSDEFGILDAYDGRPYII